MRKDVWLLVALLCGACPGGAQVKSSDFAVSERCRDEDCLTASELYKQRLAVPRRAGSIVSSRLTVERRSASGRPFRVCWRVRPSLRDGRDARLCAVGRTRPTLKRSIRATTDSDRRIRTATQTPRSEWMSSETMQAVVLEKTPEGPGLVYRSVPRPTPGPGQAQVSLHAAALNRRDVDSAGCYAQIAAVDPRVRWRWRRQLRW